MSLSEVQFQAAEDAIDRTIARSPKGSPERAEAMGVKAKWDAAYSLPTRTVDQRAARHAAIEAVATEHGLLSRVAS